MKISARMMKGIVVLIGVLFVLVPLTVFAANKVVVIPLFDVTNPKPLKNIITVAKANGNFTDPVAAVNSITDASAGNPYLVVIGPGVYTVTSTLVMKPYVDIAGSGENVTKITGAISTGNQDASSAIVSGANNSSLSSLTVENTGGGTYSIALYNSSASPRVDNVTAIASWGTYINYGVYNSSSSPTMTDVTATASGSSNDYAVYNLSSSPVMTGVTATASGGTSFNIGVANLDSSSYMINVTATASGGTHNRGVDNSYSSPVMTGVTAMASGGTYNYGVINADSYPKIRRSTMDGSTGGLYTSLGCTVTVSQSTIIGGVGGTGTYTCVACDNGSGTALNGSCQKSGSIST